MSSFVKIPAMLTTLHAGSAADCAATGACPEGLDATSFVQLMQTVKHGSELRRSEKRREESHVAPDPKGELSALEIGLGPASGCLNGAFTDRSRKFPMNIKYNPFNSCSVKKSLQPIEIWMFRVAGFQLYPDDSTHYEVAHSLAATNIGTLAAVAQFAIEKQGSQLSVGAFKVQFDPNMMSAYFHCQFETEPNEYTREKGVGSTCEWKINCKVNRQFGVCCTRIPGSMSRIGMRTGTGQRQSSECGGQDYCNKDYCLDPDKANEILQACAAGSPCFAAVPYNVDEVKVVDIKNVAAVNWEHVAAYKSEGKSMEEYLTYLTGYNIP